MASNGSLALPITPLSKESYQRWRYDTVATLEFMELMDVVDGTTAKPADTEAVELAKWRKTDAKARRVLAQGLSDDLHATIRDCTTSAEIWLKIKSLMEKSSKANKYLVNQELHQYAFTEDMSVTGYCSGLSVIHQKLTSIGVKVDEETLVAKLINDLPGRFDHFRQTFRIQVASGTDLNMREVQEQLQMIEEDLVRSGAKAIDNSGGDAFVYQAKGKKPAGQKKVRKETRTCYRCGEPGHVIRYCKAPKKKDGGQCQSGIGYMANTRTDGGSKLPFTIPLDCPGHGENFVGDSGASHHLVRNRQMFSCYRALAVPMSITIGDGNELKAIGKGRIDVFVYNGNSWNESFMDDVLHVPAMGDINLFSFGAATDKGYTVELAKEWCRIRDESKSVTLTGYRTGKDIYFLNMKVRRGRANLAAGSLQLWHQRLAHIAPATVTAMANGGMVDGIEITGSDQKNFFCDGCALGKMVKKPYRSTTGNTCEVGERIHGDLCGPMEVASLSNSKYCFLLKDEASGFRRTFFIKSKDETLEKFKEFVAEQKAQRRQTMSVFRSDNGTEFVNKRFKAYLNEKGIVHERTAPYNPSQNGRAERELRTLQELGRAMIHARALPSHLWAEAMATAAYAMNRSVNTGRDKTPMEMWTGQKPNVEHMRVFGTRAFAHIDKSHRKKWEPKARELLFVGYSNTDKNCRLYDATGRNVNEYRDVSFDPNSELVGRDLESYSFDDGDANSTAPKAEVEDEDGGTDTESEYGSFVESPPEQEDEPVAAAKRGRPPGSKNKVYEKVDRPLRSNLLMARTVPTTYDEAIQSVDHAHWSKAMKDEMDSLNKNGTWTLSYLPHGRKAIANRWLFKVKEDPDGTISRYKARLVVKGFSQRLGIDYSETWAPVARKQAMLVAMALAARHDMDIVHFDVKTAFLHGELDEDIYMVQPIGFADGTARVCHLKKALYGLKQAPRAWYHKLCTALKAFGLIRCESEPCVFVADEEKSLTILVIYVDDGLLCSTSSLKIEQLVTFLGKEFEMSVEEPHCVIGLEIERDRNRRTIKLHQAGYIKRMLDRFEMSDCRPLATPADVSLKLKKITDKSEVVDAPYAEAVGSLMFAMTCTRPDIAYAVGKVAQFMALPGKQHWAAVKHILRYLKGTFQLGIVFNGNDDELHGYCDSDYAGNQDDRKSTSGHIFLLAGGPISWQSRLQRVQALSTCEAEYVAAADAVKELLWLRQLLRDLGQVPVAATTLWCDNQGAIKLVANPEITNRTKHIDVRHHFIRDRVADGEVLVEYVPTNEQAADLLTKALHGPGFKHCIQLLGLN